MQSLKIDVAILEQNFLDMYKRNLGYHLLKRLVDVVGSLIGIIVLSPLLLIVALLIKLLSKGPIFFTQKRVGLYGKEFKMYKFRSMIVNAEVELDKIKHRNEMSYPMFKMKDDPRVTSIGKFLRKTSIDELPQLINVLRGEMSLVGPRPNLANEVAMFSVEQKIKLLVKPGLTCFWQVMGRSSIDFDEWMKLDIKYLKERSFWVDLKLIFKTFGVFLGDKNAS